MDAKAMRDRDIIDNPPALHLSYADATKLRDALTQFIEDANHGLTVEGAYIAEGDNK